MPQICMFVMDAKLHIICMVEISFVNIFKVKTGFNKIISSNQKLYEIVTHFFTQIQEYTENMKFILYSIIQYIDIKINALAFSFDVSRLFQPI